MNRIDRLTFAAVIAGLSWAALPLLAEPPAPAAEAVHRERLSLDRGWLFHLGDISFPVIKGQGPSYENAKAGHAWGAAAPDGDDSDWRTLDVPHDWAVEGPFDPEANLSQGYRQRGIGWYRRYFQLDKSDHGKHLELQFDGVATHCTVWVNGILAHRNWCGYNSFHVDITPFAKYGNDVNTIAVRVDANPMEGWWYEGAGIYRHTWLVKREAVHVATDGLWANPVRQEDGTWAVPVEAAVYSCDKSPASLEVEAVLLDPSGNVVAMANAPLTVEPLKEAVARLPLTVESPQLWSVDEPTLYEVRAEVKRDGVVVDRLATRCGFRTIRFDADRGFFLNDEPLKLKGVCNHQDHAGVGVAVPDSLWEFRIRRLKEMGANAYRCAHHPPAAEFLDACDRLGMLVIDENRNFNTTPEYMRMLEWLVRRDRNHPSVFLWSVFNEEPMQGTVQGYEMVRRMSTAVKRLDPTRPVTAAQSNSMMNRFNASLAADVAGFNYQHEAYDAYHAANPEKPIISSEDTSAVMTRGEWSTDRQRAVLSSYDTEFQPWGTTHRNAWRMIAERPFVAGTFVWTGFDYHGEPQPLEWPATGSSFGCLDLCGFPKSAYYLRQAQWIDDRPVLQLMPHWNWSGKDGEPIQVVAATNLDAVELYLNGRSLGEKPVDKYEMVSWSVPYEAGKLEAIGKRAGQEVARSAVETTGPPVALQLLPDRTSLAGDGRDTQPITVQAVDAQGRPVPDANLMVKFALAGPGSIIGLGNGDPTCHEPEKGDSRSLFNGLAQVVIQTEPQSSGALTLRATADGLAKSEVTIEVAAAPQAPEVPPGRPVFVVSNWRMSQLSERPPSSDWRSSGAGMLAGARVQPGRLQEFTDGSYAVFRAQFKPHAAVRKNGGQLVLRDLVGKAQVWVDGELAGEKNDAARQTFSVQLSPGNRERAVDIVIEALPGSQAGLGGKVTVE
jgi:beta-galactosidase